MIDINVWSDFACPFCYLGEVRLANAIRELGLEDKVRVHYRAYELDKNAPAEANVTSVERICRKHHLPENEALRRVNEISQLGRDMGLPFNYAGVKLGNTFDAHRLLKLSEDKYESEITGRLNFALFNAYFGQNRLLSDHAVLADVAAAVGLNEHDVRHVLDSDEYAEAVRQDERDSENYGVNGVPFFIIGKYVIPGAVSTEDFKDVLLRALRKEDDTDKPYDEKPHKCDGNRCDLP